MAIKQVRIKKKQNDGTWLKVHPETESGIITFDPDYSSLESTNVQDAIDELSDKLDSIDMGTVEDINGIAGKVTIEAGSKIEINTANNGKIVISANTVALDSDLQNHKNNINNPHEVTKAQVGLSDVDNTSDLDKPISNATQAALDAEVIRSNNYTDASERSSKAYADELNSTTNTKFDNRTEGIDIAINALSEDVYHKEAIKDIALTGSADDVTAKAFEAMPAGSVQKALEYLVRSIGTGGTENVVDVVKQTTPDLGFLSTYYVTQGNKKVGEKINIPTTNVQPDQPKVQLTKNLDGLLGAEVVSGSLEKTDLTEALQVEINGKQDQLTAGDNINIEQDSEGNNVISAIDTIYDDTEVRELISSVQAKEEELETIKQNKLIPGDNIDITDDVIKAIVPEVVTPETITVSREVGGYKVGDSIPAGTLLYDIIKQILQPAVPVGQTFLYWYVGNEIPSSITAEFEEEESNISIIENGKVHFFSPAKEYIAFAYDKTMGDLVHIYQNDLTMFDLIEDFSKAEVIYKGVTYNLYYVTEKLMGDNDKYEFLWR